MTDDCNSVAKIVADLFNESGDAISKLGCKVVSTVGSTVGTPIDHTACQQTVEKAEEYTREMIKFWNKEILGGSYSFLKIGPRRLKVNKSEDGNIVGPTQHTFISDPLPFNEYSITIQELDGKADTDVTICTYDSSMRHTRIASRHFNQSREQRRQKETRTVNLSDVKGKIVVVLIKGNAATRNFKYTLLLKRA